jgi:small subunit ribosomal protein S28e
MAEDEHGKGEGKGPAPAGAAVKPQEQRKPFEGYLAEVVDVVGRTGIYGEVKQAMCKILEGKDKGRVIRRNVAGKINVGDLIRLPDTTREDKPIRAR